MEHKSNIAMSENLERVPIDRRAFLQGGTLVLAAATTEDPSSLFARETEPGLRVGLVTDLHYADKPPAGTRQLPRNAGQAR